MLTVTMTLTGSAASFDTAAQAAFQVSFAALFSGVSPSDVQVTILTTSRRALDTTSRRQLQGSTFDVDVQAILPNVAAAEAAASTVSTTSPAALSSSLGVTVASVAAPAVAVTRYEAPSPPPPSPPSPTPPAAGDVQDTEALNTGDTTSQTGEPPNYTPMIIGISAGIALLICCLLFLVGYLLSHRKKKRHREHARASEDARWFEMMVQHGGEGSLSGGGRAMPGDGDMSLMKEKSLVGPLVNPPSCGWMPREGNQYACFLSHYKVEAGSDARYLKDLLQKMLGSLVFLDSNELSDLRHLFSDGVHKSDCVVLLGTRGVLTRPWCLLELWESVRMKVPVVVMQLERAGYTMDEAMHLIRNLEEELPKRNPGAYTRCMPPSSPSLMPSPITYLRPLPSSLQELLKSSRKR